MVQVMQVLDLYKPTFYTIMDIIANAKRNVSGIFERSFYEPPIAHSNVYVRRTNMFSGQMKIYIKYRPLQRDWGAPAGAFGFRARPRALCLIYEPSKKRARCFVNVLWTEVPHGSMLLRRDSPGPTMHTRSTASTMLADYNRGAQPTEQPLRKTSNRQPLGDVQPNQETRGQSGPKPVVKPVQPAKVDHRQYLCPDYAEDVIPYLRSVERSFALGPNFLQEAQVKPKHRAILIDWVVQVHHRWAWHPESLALAVHLIDQYLAKIPIDRKDMQLLSMAALFIAGKFEETHLPEMQEFEYMSANSFTREDIYKYEQRLLRSINFTLCRPAPITFLRAHFTELAVPSIVHQRAQYLIELCFQTYELCHLLPSHMALVSLALSATLYGHKLNVARFREEVGMTVVAYDAAVAALATAIIDNQNQQRIVGIKNKYTEQVYNKVSEFDAATLKEVHRLARSAH